MRYGLPRPIDAQKLKRIVTFNRMSRLVGSLAQQELPQGVIEKASRLYAKLFGVNLEEAQKEVHEFSTFADFFARELKDGIRPVARGENVAVSPADGALFNFGTVQNGRIEQIKGHDYGLAELLGNEDDALPFCNGTCATVYLSPGDYHRVHTPLAGKVTHAQYIPGALYSVSPFYANSLANLFVTNERIAIHLDTAQGKACVVMVAAVVVGKVVLTFSELTTNDQRGEERQVFSQPIPLEKGDELGAFHLGSTVVVLLEGRWRPLTLSNEMKLQMGQAIFQSEHREQG